MSSQRSDRGGSQSGQERERDEQGRFTDEDLDSSRSGGRGSSSSSERGGSSEPDRSRDRSERGDR